jgi:hypothetical protein
MGGLEQAAALAKLVAEWPEGVAKLSAKPDPS